MVVELSLQAQLLGALVVGFAVLGGVMAMCSGYLAWSAVARDLSGEELAEAFNRGAAWGFYWGVMAAPAAAMIAYLG